MKKVTLYKVKAEWVYGDDKDEKRAKQLQAVADAGLQEIEKGYVLCTGDQFVQLFKAGYCGTYLRINLMESACTDALQAELAAGWRILAIQPQPDQRRPDYILGLPLMSAMR